MLNISTREREWGEVIAVADREPDVWASVGIHPPEADAHADMDTARLVDAAEHPRVVASGETGLAFYYEHSERPHEQMSFRADRVDVVQVKSGSRGGCRGERRITRKTSRMTHSGTD